MKLQLEVFGPMKGDRTLVEFDWKDPTQPLPQFLEVNRIMEPLIVQYEYPPSPDQDPRLDWDTHANGKIIFYRAQHIFETVYMITNVAVHSWSD